MSAVHAFSKCLNTFDEDCSLNHLFVLSLQQNKIDETDGQKGKVTITRPKGYWYSVTKRFISNMLFFVIKLNP